MLRQHTAAELILTNEVGDLIPHTAFVPGDHVTCAKNSTWRGMIVSISGDSVHVLWSSCEEHKSQFGAFTTPLIRRTFSQALAKQLVSVQPMTVPSGGIFYTDYTFNKQVKKDNGKQKSSGTKRKRPKKG